MNRRVWVSFFIVQKRCWRLTMLSWLMIAAILVGSTLAIAKSAYPFLAQTKRSGSGVLVVEGWMPAYLLSEIAEIATQDPTQQIILARPLKRSLDAFESGELVAERIRSALTDRGVPPEQIRIIYFDYVDIDRTLTSARAIRDELSTSQYHPKSIDIVTLGPHARRSRLVYSRVLGDSTTVGVIAIRPRGYNPEQWWASSEGMRAVPFELFAYAYILVFGSS